MEKIYHQMMRTTWDIDKPILDRLKALQRTRGGTLGSLASEILARGLEDYPAAPKSGFKWSPSHLGKPRVDLADKEVLHAVLDED